MSKPLDLADKYPYGDPSDHDSLSDDEEPTVKVQVPTFTPKVVIEEDDDEDRDTIPDISPYQEKKRYPGVGLAIVVLTGFAFWGYILWSVFH